MIELLPAKATFAPGEELVVDVRGATGDVEVTLWHLSERVATAVAAGGAATFPAQGEGGYGVEAGEAKTALDVLADPLTRPRYGFVASYAPGREIDGIVDNARRLHLNAVQFYDWMYRHAKLVPPTDTFEDALGQTVSLDTSRRLASALRAAGSLPIAYAAVYAVGADEWPEWENEGLFHPDGKPWTLGEDFLWNVDPTADRWVEHFTAELEDAAGAGGFAGFHLDQYGQPKRALRRDGSVVELDRAFPALLERLSSALPEQRLIFNNVNDFPTWATARSPQAAIYIEVWAPHVALGHLAELVTRARSFDRDKAVILAAYLSTYATSDEPSAVAAERLQHAVVFSHGGTVLLHGEEGHVLTEAYYVSNHALGDDAQSSARRCYDFAVRYGDLLFDRDAADVTRMYSGGLNREVIVEARVPVATDCKPGSLWTRVVDTSLGRVVHLIDLSDQEDDLWDSAKVPARPLEGVLLAIERDGSAAQDRVRTPRGPDAHAARVHLRRPARPRRAAVVRPVGDGRDPRRRRMIVHFPAGRGHAYEIDPHERRPFRPVAGETLTIGATSAPGDGPVEIELDWGGSVSRSPAVRRGPARRAVDQRFGRTGPAASAGHLTEVTDADDLSGLVQSAFDVRVPAEARLLRYRFVSSRESTEWFEAGVCRWRRDPDAVVLDAPAGVESRLDRGSVEVLADGRACYRVRFALRLEPGERVVGFGERFDSVDQRGRFVDSAVFDQYKSQGARSYLPMPFGIVVGGELGFHVATGRRCYFDVGASAPNELRVEVDLEPGVDRAEIALELFAGGPADVVRAFVDRTAPELHAPPDWTYRLWLSGNEWDSQARVLHELELARAHDIAVGVLVIEAWSDEETFVAFNDARYELHEDGSPHRLSEFDFPADGRWPDPEGLVEELHGRDVKVLLWQIPLVQSDEGQAGCDRRVMAERGYAVRNPDGSPYRNPAGWFRDALLLDFTSDDATAWWLDKRRYLIDEIGVDGFKTDGGEHARGSGLVYADGTRGGETNNRYPVLYARAYQELLRSSGRDPVTFSRSGFTGAGAYPWHWAGDADSTWQAFRASIVAGVTAGASGVFFWGWDIAGFSGPLPTAELFLRSAAMAALCPLMQLHSEFNHHRLPSRDRTPWNIAEQTGDARVVPVFRHFVTLRERLVPYLAASGRSAVRERKPLMRALFFDHPSDERIWDFPYQYLLGDDLLVAPVCEEGADRWSVYVPEGEWVDAWNGNECPAGELVVDAPLDRLPVFCRAARAAELVPVFSVLPGVLSSELTEVR